MMCKDKMSNFYTICVMITILHDGYKTVHQYEYIYIDYYDLLKISPIFTFKKGCVDIVATLTFCIENIVKNFE